MGVRKLTMAYTYLLDLYQVIQKRRAEARHLSRKNPGEARFQEGRMDALSNFEMFLSESFNHKLPRKIKEQLL